VVHTDAIIDTRAQKVVNHTIAPARDLDGGGPGTQAWWEAHVRIQNVQIGDNWWSHQYFHISL